MWFIKRFPSASCLQLKQYWQDKFQFLSLLNDQINTPRRFDAVLIFSRVREGAAPGGAGRAADNRSLEWQVLDCCRGVIIAERCLNYTRRIGEVDVDVTITRVIRARRDKHATRRAIDPRTLWRHKRDIDAGARMAVSWQCEDDN